MSRVLKRLFPATLLLFLFSMPLQNQLGAQQTKSDATTSPSGPADEVNTFVGSAPVQVAGMRVGVFDTGNTFPGAALPLGMVQWSPDTEIGFLKRRAGYAYGDDKIRGFSLTHLSGAGCQIFGDVLIQPIAQPIDSSPDTEAATYWQKFSDRNELASPGYYSVGFDNGIHTQLSVSTRAGIGEFTFPASAESRLLFNVGSDATVVRSASVKISGDREISGSVSAGDFCRETRDQYTVYFAAEFNRPFTSFGTWNGPSVNRDPAFRGRSGDGRLGGI